jgi:hypothetical protein
MLRRPCGGKLVRIPPKDGKRSLRENDKGGTDQAGDRFRDGHLCSVTDAPHRAYCKPGSIPSS